MTASSPATPRRGRSRFHRVWCSTTRTEVQTGAAAPVSLVQAASPALACQVPHLRCSGAMTAPGTRRGGLRRQDAPAPQNCGVSIPPASRDARTCRLRTRRQERLVAQAGGRSGRIPAMCHPLVWPRRRGRRPRASLPPKDRGRQDAYPTSQRAVISRSDTASAAASTAASKASWLPTR